MKIQGNILIVGLPESGKSTLAEVIKSGLSSQRAVILEARAIREKQVTAPGLRDLKADIFIVCGTPEEIYHRGTKRNLQALKISFTHINNT